MRTEGFDLETVEIVNKKQYDAQQQPSNGGSNYSRTSMCGCAARLKLALLARGLAL